MAQFVRMVQLGSVAALAASLSACVVAPIDPKTGYPYPLHPAPSPAPQVVFVPSPAPAPATTAPVQTAALLSARLFPVNESARAVGTLVATVLDQGNGRGQFNLTYGNQAMQGEATRVDRNYPGFGNIMNQVNGGYNWAGTGGNRGIANAAGPTASMRCEYIFTQASLGTGACVASDGARFQIHFGQ